MANKETLVTLEMLKQYTSNVQYFVKQENKDNQKVIFDKKTNFPIIGNNNILYIDDDQIYIWSQEKNDYKLINSPGVAELLWGDF